MKSKRNFLAVGIALLILVGFSPSILAEGGASLVVEKTATQTFVRPDSTVTFSVRVQNTGSDVAHDVRVTDVLPTGLVFDTGSSERTWTFGDIAASGNAGQSYDATVASDVVLGDVTTTVSALSPDANQAEHSLTLHIVQTLPNTGADWRVFVVVVTGFLLVLLSFLGFREATTNPFLTHTEKGAYGASMTTVVQRLLAPILVILIGIQPLLAFAADEPPLSVSGPEDTGGGGGVGGPPLPPAEGPAETEPPVVPPAVGFDVPAAVTDEPITHPPGSFILTSPRLLMTVTTEHPSVTAGETVLLRYRLLNDSETAANNVRLNMTLPTFWRFTDTSVRERFYLVTPSLAAHAEAIFTVSVRSDAGIATGPHTLIASGFADDADSVSAFSLLTVTAREVLEADLVLSLRIEPSFANRGDTVTLFVDVENKGTGAADNVALTLDAPDGLLFTENGEASIISDIRTIPAGAKVSNEFSLTVAKDAAVGIRTLSTGVTLNGERSVSESLDIDIRSVSVLGATTDDALPATGMGATGQAIFFFGLALLFINGIGFRKAMGLRGKR